MQAYLLQKPDQEHQSAPTLQRRLFAPPQPHQPIQRRPIGSPRFTLADVASALPSVAFANTLPIQRKVAKAKKKTPLSPEENVLNVYFDDFRNAKPESDATQTFEDGDTVNDLIEFLKINNDSYQFNIFLVDSGTRIKCNPSTKLVKGGRYIVEAFTFAAHKPNDSKKMVNRRDAQSMVQTISTLVRKTFDVFEAQAMLLGSSIVVSVNFQNDFDKTKVFEKTLSKVTVGEFLKQIGGYDVDKKTEEDLDEDKLVSFFKNVKDEKVVLRKSAEDLTSLNAPLILLYGRTPYGKSQDHENWHAEQNLLLSLMNLIMLQPNMRRTIQGVVVGGYKAPCGTCAEVLKLLKQGLQDNLGMEVHYPTKGILKSTVYGSGRTSRMGSKHKHADQDQIAEAIKDTLAHNAKEKDEQSRLANLVKAIRLAGKVVPFEKKSDVKTEQKEYSVKDIKKHVGQKLHKEFGKSLSDENIQKIQQLLFYAPGIGLDRACRDVLKIKSKGDYDNDFLRNNCLITAMNGGIVPAPNLLQRIRQSLLNTTGVPPGEPLIDDEITLQVIAIGLGIQNMTFEIESGGTRRFFQVTNERNIVFVPDAPDHIDRTIKHTAGGIGHFEYQG